MPSVKPASPWKGVLFDFDYTLADSSPGIIDCTQHAFTRLGQRAPAPDAIRRTIGFSLPAMYKTLGGSPGGEDDFCSHFKSRADEVMVQSTTLFSGVAALLEELQARRLRVGIVSTKYRHRIESVLARDGALGLVQVIVGGEDVQEHKPSPEGLLSALGKLALTPLEALYVGDSMVDVHAARNAGVSFAGVATGTTAAGQLRPHSVFPVLGSVIELPESLDRATDLASTAQAGKG